ncbi:hypothetical protein MPLSOD_340140 [Mesorhizobium sp. SOD10]|jgi:hypothetical protein|nr:hypothetical protein MPLSOD_340140 [Mesorhizobium sp. SOD10]
MPKVLANLSDSDLRRLISYFVRILERSDLADEQRKLVERRYAICISEALRRGRERIQKTP